MQIPVASDHAGFEAKQKVVQIIKDLGHTPVDMGPESDNRVDYPDYAAKLSSAVDKNEFNCGILICGSGQGMCMTANKFANIRAALVYNAEIAALTKQHNNANIICLPGRFLSDDELKAIVRNWLEAEFEGGRHTCRVEKIKELTQAPN